MLNTDPFFQEIKRWASGYCDNPNEACRLRFRLAPPPDPTLSHVKSDGGLGEADDLLAGVAAVGAL